MTDPTRSRIKTFAIVVASVLVAALLRHLLEPHLHEAAPFTVFFIAIVVSAWYGGLLPGLVATFISAAIATYFFVSDEALLLVERLSVFILVGTFISALAGSRLRAMRRLEHTVERLRWMSTELTLAEDRQRRALAQALHDHLQQLLVASRLKLNRLTRDDQPESTRTAAKDVDQLLNESIAYTRTLTVDLSPKVLHTAGLAAALEGLKDQVGERYNLAVAVEAEPDAEPGEEATRVLFYQAIRELLFNVVKHARTDRATVRLNRVHGHVQVIVEDGGVGVPAGAKPGLGLLSVEEKLLAMGGCMHMERVAPGSTGTRVVLIGPRERAHTPPAQPATAPLLPTASIAPASTTAGPRPS